jgi:hypothetical protein
MSEPGGPTTQTGIIYQNSLAALFIGRICDPARRPERERVQEVRVEAPENVDDIIVTFGDGHRAFIQAKETVGIGDDAWRKLWGDFDAQYRGAGFQRGRDRLVLHVGDAKSEYRDLKELCLRASSSPTETEWRARLNKRQGALIEKISPSLSGELRAGESLAEFFAHVQVEIWSLEEIERDKVRDWMPPTEEGHLPIELFRLLRDRVGGEARRRGSFTFESVRQSLADEGYRLCDVSKFAARRPRPAQAEAGAPPRLFGPIPFRCQVYAEPGNVAKRKTLLGRLHAELHAKGCVALYGMPGVGKTQAAVEFAHRHRDEYQVVFYLNAQSSSTFTADVTDTAARLGLPLFDDADSGAVRKELLHWMQDNSGWLAIVDNGEDPREFQDLLTTGRKGHLLLITRDPSIRSLVPGLEVEKLKPEVGAWLFLRQANLLHGERKLDHVKAEYREPALSISREMDGLALAIDQASAFVLETQCSPGQYLDLYKTEGVELRRRRGDQPASHPDSVSATFSIAFRRLGESSPAAADLMRFCAFLSGDSIPVALLATGAPGMGPGLSALASSELARLEAISRAQRLSLIRHDPDARSLSVHRLVQDVLRDEMEGRSRKLWTNRVVRAVAYAFPRVDPANWHLCDQLLPHALFCARRIHELRLKSLVPALMLNNAALYLEARGRYTEAEPLLRLSLSVHERLERREPTSEAQTRDYLGTVLYRLGRYDEAELLLHQAMVDFAGSAADADTGRAAANLNNLGLLYQAKRRFRDAEQ